jgi:tungstate transport system permease protein
LIIATLLGLPLAALLGLKRFLGRGLIINLLNTFMGLPPVVVGLFVYLLLSRKGPFGFLGLLYSPSAMVIAQTILAFPIVSALCHSAIVNVPSVIRQAAKTLGATPSQEAVLVVREARYGIMAGIIAGFGRVMAEVGAILMVGGNIAGYTRVMTTTIALETDKGNFELALALVLDPEVLFLDEPTASIDPDNTQVIEEIILKLRQKTRTVVVMATHHMEQVTRIADQVIRIDLGKITSNRILYPAT